MWHNVQANNLFIDRDREKTDETTRLETIHSSDNLTEHFTHYTIMFINCFCFCIVWLE